MGVAGQLEIHSVPLRGAKGGGVVGKEDQGFVGNASLDGRGHVFAVASTEEVSPVVVDPGQQEGGFVSFDTDVLVAQRVHA